MLLKGISKGRSDVRTRTTTMGNQMNIEQLTRDEIISHTAEILDNQVSQRDHNRAIVIATLIGLAIGLCA